MELSPIAQFIVNTMNNKALKDAHAIQRVRALHKPTKNYGYEFERCEACWDMRTDSAVNYPCPTIKALDGEQ